MNESVLAAWRARLAAESCDLDLATPDDRGTFRGRVVRAVDHVKVGGLRALAAALGADRVGASRESAARAVADAWIAGGR